MEPNKQLTFAAREDINANHLPQKKIEMNSSNNATASTCCNASGSIQLIQQHHAHDILFHVIFGCDAHALAEFVHASAVRLYSIVRCPFLEAMMDHIIVNQKGNRINASMDVLKALFFLFLNVDMVLKEYVCNPGSKAAFASAMNLKPCCEGMDRMHAWSMVGTKPISPAKARGFFKVLHDKVVKNWLQDERFTPSDLVKMVKDEYLVA